MLMKVKSEYVMLLGADNWLGWMRLNAYSEYQSDIVTYDIIVTGRA
jgi:hypothetical protein